MRSEIDMARAEDDTFLVFFEAQCRGVKLYDLSDAHLDFGVPIAFRRDPSNPHDANVDVDIHRCRDLMISAVKCGLD